MTERSSADQLGSRPGRWRRLGFRLRIRRASEESTAAAVYGLIVSGGVLAASHAHTAWGASAFVLGTLVIYWSAERYARVVAERIHAGHRPPWEVIRRRLTEGWELVSASAIPLACMVIVRLLGAKVGTAIMAGLICTTVLLALTGWEIGRNGRLTTPERLMSAAVAAAFGVGMIGLKTLAH
ncbi:hypothetical protein [Cryptosporangium aurantiacum]|uniref:Uncharacterized protein n=1 Tax=Cryptosporangium aurantiacum TaxID=134849 RepID=A0A1M7Q3Z8_9ACTN|nr:hypothetical protein [Cryptosporangium aurantiacum]SHN24936.1 hypothetical protein SAMN05443668_104107 [Cryptosporangium aurantiacum]